MHSRIFQISEKPIPKDEYFNEERYYDSFVGSIADYVAETKKEDRESELQWLEGCMNGAVKREGEKFTIINKHAYFKPMFKQFVGNVKLLKNISFEHFVGEEKIEKVINGKEYQMDIQYLMNWIGLTLISGAST